MSSVLARVVFYLRRMRMLCAYSRCVYVCMKGEMRGGEREEREEGGLRWVIMLRVSVPVCPLAACLAGLPRRNVDEEGPSARPLPATPPPSHHATRPDGQFFPFPPPLPLHPVHHSSIDQTSCRLRHPPSAAPRACVRACLPNFRARGLAITLAVLTGSKRGPKWYHKGVATTMRRSQSGRQTAISAQSHCRDGALTLANLRDAFLN